MKAFDSNYQLLDEMYEDEYFPDFLVDKVKNELQKGHRPIGEWRDGYRGRAGKVGRSDLRHQRLAG